MRPIGQIRGFAQGCLLAGAGYDIAASVSMAETTTSAASISADTTFNFSSPYATGGNPSTQANPNAPATATSATAKGTGATASASTAVQGGTASAGAAGAASTLSSLLPWALIGGAVYLLWKHFHKPA